jgi:hypothetical protein
LQSISGAVCPGCPSQVSEGYDMKISDLKEFVDKTVTLRMTDGEVLRVRVLFRSEEYNDIIMLWKACVLSPMPCLHRCC